MGMTEISCRPDVGRTVSSCEVCGMECRSNIVRVGGRINLHRHSYDHLVLVMAGWFDCETVAKDGVREIFQVASSEFSTEDPTFNSRGNRIVIPAWSKHTFVLRGAKEVGEILCIWPKESL